MIIPPDNKASTIQSNEKRSLVNSETRSDFSGGPQSTVKTLGRQVSNQSYASSSDYRPSQKFDQVVALVQDYVRMNYGSSPNYEVADFFHRANNNPANHPHDGPSGFLNSLIQQIDLAVESKTQLYYDKYNGKVYKDRSNKSFWSTGNR
jgi:hypothetical protein